jgi:hypothetical protein
MVRISDPNPHETMLIGAFAVDRGVFGDTQMNISTYEHLPSSVNGATAPKAT